METNSDNINLTHVIGKAVIDKNFGFSIADEDIYAFLGARVVPMFTGYIHPDDRDAFLKALRIVDEQGEKYTVIRLKNFMEEYSLVVMYIKKSVTDSSQYELNMYDIVYLVKEYESINNQLTKIKLSMHLLNPMLTFDYTVKTGFIRVFNDRDETSFEGRLEDWYKSMVESGCIDKVYVSTFTKLYNDIKECADSMTYALGMDIMKTNKGMQQVTVRTTPVYDDDNSTIISIVGVIIETEQDISDSSLIYNRSNLDPLTGLYNKAAIKDYAVDALNPDNGVVTYVIMDLDHFKEVNDTYGHMYGDEVILNVARIMKNVVGKKGYVGRIGGDEFFAVLVGVGSELEELRPVLRAIRSQVEWAYRGKLGNIKLTASVGCASYPKDADNYNDLFKLADNSLYCAKTKGRNRFVVYTQSIHGTLDQIKSSDNSIHINQVVSPAQRLEFVSYAVNRLCEWKKDVITSVLKDMIKYFSVNVIDVYDVETAKCIYSTEDISEKSEDNVCNYLNDIGTSFREGNIFAYGDFNNLKVPYPAFYAYTQKENYFSLLVYAVKDKGEITYLISAYSRGAFEKYSDTDLSLYSIIFRTIGDKLLN